MCKLIKYIFINVMKINLDIGLVFQKKQVDFFSSIYLKNKNDLFFKDAWQVYLESFPLQERRTLDEQVELFSEEKYKMLCYTKDNILLSIVFYWHISSYTFLEHFAVNSSLRGQFYGSEILKNFIKEHKNIVLEIEPIIDEITKKRQKFYEKFDFVLNNHKHYQVPFRKDEKELKLLLMSQKKPLSKNRYKILYKQMQKTLNFVNNNPTSISQISEIEVKKM